MIKKPFPAGGNVNDPMLDTLMDSDMFDAEKRAEELSALVKREELRRREEALLLEKGVNLNKESELQQEEEKSLLENGWKYLFQHLFEDCISQNSKENPSLVECSLRLLKLLKEYKRTTERHVKEIIDELSLPAILRHHEQSCIRLYGNDLVQKNPIDAAKEIPSMLVYQNPKYTVKIAVSKSVNGIQILREKGLDPQAIDDDMVTIK